MHRRYARRDGYTYPDPHFDFEEERRHTTRRRVSRDRPEPVGYWDNPELVGDYFVPEARGAGTGIQPPAISVPYFEINQGLLNNISRGKFSGDPSQNPLDHIQDFDRACSMYRVNGVSMDTIKMMVLPFSLEGAASSWEKEVSTRLVQTWDMVKGEFLKAFFSKEKTLEIRKMIHSFKQGPEESFCRAWDRLKQLVRDCPHHGLSRSTIIGTFYHGCHRNFKDMMDASSGGSLAAVSVDEGESIINRIASNWRGHTVEKDRGDNADVTPAIRTKESEPLTHLEPETEGARTKKAESHRNNPQRVEDYKPPIKQQNNRSNKDSETENIRQKDNKNLSIYLSEIRTMILSLTQGHEASSSRTMGKLEKIGTRLNEKVDALEERNAVFRFHIGFLSRRGEKISTSREYVLAVTLRNGKELPERPKLSWLF